MVSKDDSWRMRTKDKVEWIVAAVRVARGAKRKTPGNSATTPAIKAGQRSSGP